MATINKSDHAGALVTNTSDPAEYRPGPQPTLSHPLAVDDHEVTGADKLTLAEGTRICRVASVTGEPFYAISGDSGDDDIGAGDGMWFPGGAPFDVPVGRNAAGELYDSLLVFVP